MDTQYLCEMMRRILGKATSVLSDEEVNMLFYVGEPVKVIDGPFSGFSV